MDLSATLAEARERWPGIRVDEATLAGWIEARGENLRLVDLVLACACAGGDPVALAAFDAYLVRFDDDLKQQVRERLFVGPAPKIATYGGRGDLGSWVKTIATRLAIDASRGRHDVPTEDALLDAIELDPARVADVLKSEARAIMQGALRAALAGLPDGDRTLLLQYYIDGVGVVPLGKLHGLAASNISRRLAKARLALLAHIKKALAAQHQLAGRDLDSVIALVQSQLTVTGGLRG